MSEGPTRRSTSRALATLLIALLSSGFLAANSTSASATSRGAIRVTASESSFGSLINASRRQYGLKPLRVVSDLTVLARSWSTTMAHAGDIWHNPRLTARAGAWRVVGENVGVGGNVQQLEDAFMASPGHRANVLSGSYTEVGIGVVRYNGTLYVTEDFRRPVRAASATVLSPRKKPVVAVHPVIRRHTVAVALTPHVAAAPTATDFGLLQELARLTALPPAGQSDPVGSALGFLNTMRGLTT